MGELAGWGGARGDEPLQIVSFGFVQEYGIFLLHNGMSVPAVSFCNRIKRNGVLGAEEEGATDTALLAGFIGGTSTLVGK